MSTGVHQYEDKLLDFAYGELPANEAAAVDAHVRTCAKCGQALAQIKGVRSVFAPLPMVAAPEAGLESLLGYAEQHARRAKEKTARPWRAWLFGLASAAALIVVGVVASRASDEGPQNARDVVASSLKAEQKNAPTAAPAAAVVAPDPAPEAQKLEEAKAEVWKEVAQGKRGAVDKKAVLNEKEAERPRQQAEQSARLEAPEDVLTPPPNRGMDGYRNGQGNAYFDAPSDLGTKKKAEKAQPVGNTLAKDATGARASESKRAAEPNLADNWSNVGAGAVQEELRRDQAKSDQLNDGTSVKQSINSGSANNRPGFGVSAGPQVNSETDFGKASASERVAPPPPPVVAAAPPQAPAPKSEPAPAKPKAYGIPRAMPSSMSSAPAADDEVSVTDSVSRSGDADASRARQLQLAVDAQLAQARASSNAGDRRGEVIAAIAALNAGATGYSRAEALKRACDGYEALGEFDRAQSFCDRLLAEFSGTAAARQVADRRKNQLKAPAPARKSYDFDQAEEKKPAEAATGQAL